MHPVQLSDGEVELMKQAREEKDWTILPTFKLKYLYQRLVALPNDDIQAIKDIAAQAHEVRFGEQVRSVNNIFGLNDDP